MDPGTALLVLYKELGLGIVSTAGSAASTGLTASEERLPSRSGQERRGSGEGRGKSQSKDKQGAWS